MHVSGNQNYAQVCKYAGEAGMIYHDTDPSLEPRYAPLASRKH